jgi:hypothetical protein
MEFGKPIPLRLDYAAASSAKLLGNLSCAAAVGERLWTVSDEGRTLECLKHAGNEFKLETQYEIDSLFGDLLDGGGNDEIDLEAMSFDGARLWLCGSHCRVRQKPRQKNHLDPNLRRRSSRHLFGSIALDKNGVLTDDEAIALPATGAGSLRSVLREDPYLQPFLKLPSKEGGLDIEGLLVTGGRAYLGLRGPLIDSVAVIMEIDLSEALADGVSITHQHFIGMNGLGVRGLAMWGKHILIIAGPVADAPGPFSLFSWRPRRTERIQGVTRLLDWPANGEKPEGICRLSHPSVGDGLLVLFDSPAKARLSARGYVADFLPLKTGRASRP